MRLSKLADYAVVLMAEAARHCGGAAVYGRLNAGQLAEESGVPLPTVRKLVSVLSTAGLVESSRGVGGGLRLARPPAAISLADIIEAVEGPVALTHCTVTGNHDCELEPNCRVRGHWHVVNRAFRETLANVTLADLATAPAPVSPPQLEAV